MVVILKFLLFLLIGAVVIVLLIAYAITKQFRNAYKRFKQNPQQQQTHVNGNVIYDQRSPEQRNQQKIISDDEGEYVDYE